MPTPITHPIEAITKMAWKMLMNGFCAILLTVVVMANNDDPVLVCVSSVVRLMRVRGQGEQTGPF